MLAAVWRFCGVLGSFRVRGQSRRQGGGVLQASSPPQPERSMWTRTRTDGLACLAHDTASSLVQGRPRCCSHHKAQARPASESTPRKMSHAPPRVGGRSSSC